MRLLCFGSVNWHGKPDLIENTFQRRLYEFSLVIHDITLFDSQ